MENGWQEPVALAIVAAAALSLLWTRLRSRRSRERGCAGSCACEPGRPREPGIPPEGRADGSKSN